MSEIHSLYKPRRQFLPFHSRGQRWGVLVCHRRAGKTVALVNDLLERAMLTKKPHARFSYVAPFFSQAKAVAFDYLMRYSEPYRKKHNVAELQVELVNGARVRLYGGDNPDALRGLYHDGIGIDEPAQLKPRLWREVIRPSLADREGWAVFTGTPAGKNEFYDIWTRGLTKPDEWFAMMLKASESGILPESELVEARETMEDDDYAQEFECSFDAAIKGAYYGKAINAMSERLCPVEYDPTLPVHVSLDIGWRDDTSLWFWQSVGKEHRFIDCESESGLTVADWVAVMRSKEYHYGNIWLPHDAFAKTMQTGKSTFELFAECGIRAMRVPELSVQQGILATRQLLNDCWINTERCSDGIEALRQYQREWDERKQSFRENPRHDWASHYADSFRYAAVVINISSSEFRNRIVIPKSKEPYDPRKPFGGNVRLEDMWSQARLREERI